MTKGVFHGNTIDLVLCDAKQPVNLNHWLLTSCSEEVPTGIFVPLNGIVGRALFVRSLQAKMNKSIHKRPFPDDVRPKYSLFFYTYTSPPTPPPGLQPCSRGHTVLQCLFPTCFSTPGLWLFKRSWRPSWFQCVWLGFVLNSAKKCVPCSRVEGLCSDSQVMPWIFCRN